MRDKGLTTDVVFLDLSKAFDLVPHERLLTEMHAYGIQGLRGCMVTASASLRYVLVLSVRSRVNEFMYKPIAVVSLVWFLTTILWFERQRMQM